MKMRIRQLPAVQKNQTAFNALQTQTVSKSRLPTQFPRSLQINLSQQNLLQEKLIKMESERKQATGRVYLNMLPPR